MDKLNKLISLCKNSVNITINEHRDDHQSIEEYFTSNPITKDYLLDVEEEVYDKMIESDTLIDLQLYSDTGVGFYQIYHYDLDKACDMALSAIDKQSKEYGSEYEYEMFIEGDDNTPFTEDTWIKISSDMIKNPSKIEYYIQKGLLRKI